jgi:hypothetical protein
LLSGSTGEKQQYASNPDNPRTAGAANVRDVRWQHQSRDRSGNKTIDACYAEIIQNLPARLLPYQDGLDNKIPQSEVRIDA